MDSWGRRAVPGSGGKYHAAVRCPGFQPGSEVVDVAFVAACGRFVEGEVPGRRNKIKGLRTGLPSSSGRRSSTQ